jgi:hypothetical protein
MLTETQKKQLNKMPVVKLLEYIDKGNISFPDDFEFVDDVKIQQIKEQIAQRPNPQEVRDWEALAPEMGSNSETLKLKLQQYISRWESAMPAGNHLAEAKNKIAEIDAARRAEEEQKEKDEWDALDMFDASSLMSYLRKYPNSVHKSEIDDAVWALVSSSPTPAKSINEYLSYFPSGAHVHEADRALQEYAAWQTIKSNRDLLSVAEYVEDHSDSPFIGEANILLLELKEEEIAKMKSMASSYPVDTLMLFLREGIISDDELISRGVVTNDSLDIIRNLDLVRDGLPDINTEIQNCRRECAAGRTDVFLFGIPATGKSCILMGLIGSPAIDVSYVRAGGPYAAALQQYLDAGFTIGQTPADFVATLEADIPNGGQTHFVNLVEMAGEDFAFKLAQNPDNKISFSDMGAGASELLSNKNRKAFFLIVDPTASVVSFNRIVTTRDADGNEQRRMIRSNVNQRIILKRMVDLFALPENAHIMENVDSIHIIVTKADMCGNDVERDEKAYELFMTKYQSIIRPLANICEKYGINVATNGFPKLYTFSLGKFYVGGIYQYDESDANKLVNVIKGNVWGEKKPSFIDKVRAMVTHPII